MAELSDLRVQITLTVSELQNLVAVANMAAEILPEDECPAIVADLSEMYFELMENLRDGFLGEFEPE